MLRWLPLLQHVGRDLRGLPLTDHQVRRSYDAAARSWLAPRVNPASQRLAAVSTVVLLLAVAARAFDGDGSDVGADQRFSDPRWQDVEEVVVVAERLEKGAIPNQTVLVQTYSVRRRAMMLYDEQRYGEALPLLLLVAKRGFKWPQAMAGDILLHGRGEVDRDLESGIGWLGVAAAPYTDPKIDTYFKQVLAEFPERQRKNAVAVVRRYRDQWRSEDWRVACRHAAGGPGVSQVNSLRLRRRLSCSFMDEVPVCRAPYLDPSLVELVGGIRLADQMRWECPTVSW